MNAAEFSAIIKDLSYLDWHFRTGDMGEGFFLQVQFDAPDNDSSEPVPPVITHGGRKWYVSRHATRGEVVQTAFLAAKTAMEHELRERFFYRGKAIFGPHFDVERLVELCEAGAHEMRDGPVLTPA